MVVRAERNADSSFVSGFILGGIVCGGLAFLFAPQVRRPPASASAAPRSSASLVPRCRRFSGCCRSVRGRLTPDPRTLPPSQISRALLGDDQRLKLPRFMEDEQIKDPEATKQDLIEKIAQLNSSIDEVAAQLKTREAVEGETVAA